MQSTKNKKYCNENESNDDSSTNYFSSFDENRIILEQNTNQALGLAKFAIDFLNGRQDPPSQAVYERTKLFHLDSVVCAITALQNSEKAPKLLAEEASTYPDPNGCFLFDSTKPLKTEKAIMANISAVREYDANGTVFGYNPELKHTAGEFGHNDFYPVVIAACQCKGFDGRKALQAMVLLDEIRGRLAEVFSLKTYSIDHTVFGAIASCVVYGALVGATPLEIESAIGITVAHYIPYRAIRAGEQLSHSKGCSAAFNTEVAILAVKRSMNGFKGPLDIFRNRQSVFLVSKPYKKHRKTILSPFRLILSHSGDKFAIMDMHFKMGIYEHQSAGAIQALINVLKFNSSKLSMEGELCSHIHKVRVQIYQPAFGIIGGEAKRNPKTRQSADHSMVYILARLLIKFDALQRINSLEEKYGIRDNDQWQYDLILEPKDYSEDDSALFDPKTREVMEKIVFEHGGDEFDKKYPEGIPTSLSITIREKRKFETYSSGLIMYPTGHAHWCNENEENEKELKDILELKFLKFIKFEYKKIQEFWKDFMNLEKYTVDEIKDLYRFKFKYGGD